MTFETIRLSLNEPRSAYAALVKAWECIKAALATGQRLSLEIRPETRSLRANARMWALLRDVAEQVQWPVDGMLTHISPEDWKHIMTAAAKQHQRMAKGLDGGLVFLGQHTSRMTSAEISDVMAIIEAFGASRGVKWSVDEEFEEDDRRGQAA